MENETKNEENQEEKEVDLVAEAKKIAEELRANIQEGKKFRAQEMISGRSSVEPPPQKKVSTPQEYAEAALRGQILDY